MNATLRRHQRENDLRAWAMLSPALIFIAVVFFVPLGYMAWTSFSDPVLSFDNYRGLFTDELVLRVMRRTFLTALGVTVACLLVAYPIAFYAATRRNLLSAALILAATLTFWISFIVRTYAWMVILGNRGPLVGLLSWLGFDPVPRILFTSTATLIGLTHVLLPYMVLALYAVMARIDGNLHRAALGLGASPPRSFWHVYLPLSLPGVVNGCLLAFIFCLGFYITPALLGGPQDQMIASLIASELNELLEWGIASAMAMMLLIVTLVVLLAYDRFFGLDRLWG